MINPLLIANLKADPFRALRPGLFVAIETGVLLALIGNAQAIHEGAGRTAIAHWLSGLLTFVFWAGFLVAGLDKYVDVMERSNDIGILRVLGASQAWLFGAVCQETVLFAIPGALLGLFFAWLGSSILEVVSGGMIEFSMSWVWSPVVAAIAALGPILSGLIAIPGAIRDGVAQGF